MSGADRLAAADVADQPELLLVADVGEVPDQRRHQRRVLADQVVVVDRVGQQRRCGRGRGPARRRSGRAAAPRSPVSSAGRLVGHAAPPAASQRRGAARSSVIVVGQAGRQVGVGQVRAQARSSRSRAAAASGRVGQAVPGGGQPAVGHRRGERQRPASDGPAASANRAASTATGGVHSRPAGCPGSAPPGSRAAAPAGRACSGGSRGRRYVGGRGSAPSIQSANCTPAARPSAAVAAHAEQRRGEDALAPRRRPGRPPGGRPGGCAPGRCRQARHPGGRPAGVAAGVPGGGGERATRARPERVHRRPARRAGAAPAGVEADLQAGGAAHHRAAVRARAGRRRGCIAA